MGELRPAPRQSRRGERHRPAKVHACRRSSSPPSRCRPPSAQKLERSWGAEVSDQFGMTEGALISVQAPGEDGLRMWTDLFFCEVVDETTGEPVPEGEVGSLVMTPLWNNNVTPFLRWSSGDLVSMTAGRGRRRAVVGVPDDAACPPHGRFLQGARRQHQSQRAGRLDVLQCRPSRTSKPRSINPKRGLDVLRLWSSPSAASTPDDLQRRWSPTSPGHSR